MLWAAINIGFFAFLRSSELLLPDGVNYDPSRHLAYGDIKINRSMGSVQVIITIKSSKTDQAKHGMCIYLNSTGKDLCPVAALLGYLKVRGHKAGLLCVHKDGSPLRRSYLVKGIRRMLQGYPTIDTSKYACHRLRIGAATTAASQGVSESIIKRLGRWKSSAYQIYIRPPQSQLANLSRKLLT